MREQRSNPAALTRLVKQIFSLGRRAVPSARLAHFGKTIPRDGQPPASPRSSALRT